jgi:uncharacterized membrane protein
MLPLMTFGEAFINGIVISAAVMFRPNWVRSFDDGAYLWKR